MLVRVSLTRCRVLVRVFTWSVRRRGRGGPPAYFPEHIMVHRFLCIFRRIFGFAFSLPLGGWADGPGGLVGQSLTTTRHNTDNDVYLLGCGLSSLSLPSWRPRWQPTPRWRRHSLAAGCGVACQACAIKILNTGYLQRYRNNNVLWFTFFSAFFRRIFWFAFSLPLGGWADGPGRVVWSGRAWPGHCSHTGEGS